MNSGKIVLGMLAGVAAGALLGILFAPDKGTNTRRKIVSTSEDYADAMKEKMDDFLDMLTKKFNITKEEAREMYSKGKGKYEKFKQEVEEEEIA